MPVLLPPTPLNPLEGLVGRTLANNQTTEALRVICSFPVSGQYGAGSRILYYVLIAACILARKTEWLRNACLAAALIFPAIAAVHGIVLAALHLDDAVDLDIYGALQLCSIGVLTAPASVRLSNTYFNSEGRSIIFVWSMLVLSGLLALAVEFFRIQSRGCFDDVSGQPIRGSDFVYGNTTCNLTCSVDLGPTSPMRGGSADNIYVVPIPNIIGFGTATLIAAACCIPGVLSIVSTWNKILKSNWTKQFGVPETDEVIEGTNGATLKGMKGVNDVIRRLLSVVEVPVFGAAVIALIVVGEKNFWSDPLAYQTEPIASVGQWWSIGASVLAACGSLYLLLAEYLERAEKGPTMTYPPGHCACHCHNHESSSQPCSLSEYRETDEIPRLPEMARTSDVDRHMARRDTVGSHHLTPTRTDTYPDTEGSAHGLGIRTFESGSSATGKLMKLAVALGTASSDRFDDYAFRQGKVTSFPEVPGENQRNSRLVAIRQQWGETSQEDDDALNPRGRRSRANSFNGGISRSNSIGLRAPSPHPPTPTQPSGAGPSVLGLPTSASPEASSESIFPARPSAELEKTKSQGTVVTLHQGVGVGSPDIVLSSEDEPSGAGPSDAADPPRRPPIESLPPRLGAQDE